MPGPERDSSPGPSRLKNFKNVGKNIDEMRRRRQETSVELRKQKKDEQMIKRRNVCLDDFESPASPEAVLASAGCELPSFSSSFLKADILYSKTPGMSMEEIINGVASCQPTNRLAATQAARKMLSKERNPPIDTIINAGVIGPLVSFLAEDDNPALQFESAWAITNIASGTSDQTKAVANTGAVKALIRLLPSPHQNVAEQAVWALGNISGDGPELRDFVIDAGIIPPLLSLLRPNLPDNYLGNITWTMSNLCRNKNPCPPFKAIKECLPTLAMLIRHTCEDVRADACWALSYFTDGDNQKIQAVIDTGVVRELVALLQSNILPVMTPALRTLGNIVTGSDAQTDEVIGADALNVFPALLMHPKPNVVKEAAWTISNIAAGNVSQIQACIDAGTLEPMCYVLEHGEYRSQKEAAWVITNMTNGGTNEQIITILQAGILVPFCGLLSASDAKTVIVVLEGLINILETAIRVGQLERVCEIIEECKALDKLEELQNHENVEIYRKVSVIIEKYFGAEEEDVGLTEVTSTTNGNYEFAGNSSVPEGGYSF